MPMAEASLPKAKLHRILHRLDSHLLVFQGVLRYVRILYRPFRPDPTGPQLPRSAPPVIFRIHIIARESIASIPPSPPSCRPRRPDLSESAAPIPDSADGETHSPATDICPIVCAGRRISTTAGAAGTAPAAAGDPVHSTDAALVRWLSRR